MAVIKRKATAKKRLTPTQRGTWGGDRPATPRRKAPSGAKAKPSSSRPQRPSSSMPQRQSLLKILGALEKLIAEGRRGRRPSASRPARESNYTSATRRRP